MPLGDSITEDTCYPQLLSKDFITGGHTNFVFVGSSTNNQSCGANAPSLKSEGHGGYLVCDLVGSGQHAAELMPWCTADQADMVFMHFGTNDCWGNQRTTTQILSAYTTIVGDLRSVKPNVIIFVAQIIPLNPAGCTGCDGYAQALNSQIPAWATGLSTAASPIFVVDMHSVFTPATSYTPGSTYTADGVHPNAAGAQLMADKMYAAISSHGYF
jgi:lysophospholipase L1-like esterase